MVHGNAPDEVRKDTEGMEIAYNLGRNMAWMVKALGDMTYTTDPADYVQMELTPLAQWTQ